MIPLQTAADARRRPEHAAFGLPPGDGGLGAKDFLGAHPLEPIVACVEFAHMLKAEPAPIARPVKAIGAAAGRAEFPRLAAARRFAPALRPLDAPMKPW